MKTNLSNLNTDSFNMRPATVAGEMVFLVFPKHIGAKWHRDNLHFRSSMWNLNGELISAGFKKFFNDGEQPDLAPVLNNLRGAEIMEKLDGSLLTVTKYKGEIIARTRGTSTIADLDNGFELDFLKDKYPLVFDNVYINDGTCSLIYEWTTPANRIVLKYGDEPELRLIGMIYHADYTLARQTTLDAIAPELGVARPKFYSFDSKEDMEAAIEAMQGAEGFCVYLNEGQEIRKVKSPWYLAHHRMKGELRDIEGVLELYFQVKLLTYNEFLAHIEQHQDYETMMDCRGHASNVYEAEKEVRKILDHMKAFADSVRHLSRRDAAIAIQKAYGTTNRSGYVFSFLDGKDLKQEAVKKLFYQVMKK